MDISLNNAAVKLEDGATITALLAAQSIAETGVAVALNNRIVTRVEWATTEISDGDKVTVIQATYGG
ncbi:MAG: sulfur carrier protein ThiS [Rikenellaceae bacterium]